MPTKYAVGKKAFGFCDVCGQRYLLARLKKITVKGKQVNIMSCPECWDSDHPQLKLGMYPISDPQALKVARPDTSLVESRDIQWGWSPVGGGDADSSAPNDLAATGEVGDVTVSVP